MNDATTSEVNEPTATSTIDELKALIREAEEALGHSGDDDQIDELRDRLREAVSDGETMLHNLTANVKKQAQRADQAIRANPYQTAAIATGIGLLAGFLISRRSSRD
jgi:ElaB/YqjD/DUF883 family membrane-anchored ribosome-binding protein